MPNARAGSLCVALALAISLRGTGAGAQQAGPPTPQDPRIGSGAVTLPIAGGAAEDRGRTDQILGLRPASGFLVRSASDLGAASRLPDRFVGLIRPEVDAVWNAGLPHSFNDRTLWAGRGLNVSAVAGAAGRLGPVLLVLAPEVTYSQNAAFQTFPYPDAGIPPRDPFASPFHPPPGSADLPMRFGDRPLTRLGPGQSSLSVDAGPVAIGVASENLWWGPAVRNALVMSSHAPGIPHAFLRTDGPLSTPIGTVSGRWILGGLRESRFFDEDPDNDWRTISALAVALTPSVEPDLTLGAARAVVAPLGPGESAAPALFDVFRNVGRPNSTRDPEPEPGADQIFSLFARWIFPDAGFEAYAEWARFEQPASLRDLLTSPNHSQGYTLGLQWARPVDEAAFRLQGELTYLEPSSTFRQRPLVSTYTSRVVEHGFTHQGQILGASIGPGASSQWLALDYLGETARVGAFVGRIRWEEEVHETVIPRPDILNHDLSVFGGLRGGIRVSGMDVTTSLTTGIRYNYLFQNPLISLGEPAGTDVRFASLAVSISPASR